jgi:hypothetical protein
VTVPSPPAEMAPELPSTTQPRGPSWPPAGLDVALRAAGGLVAVLSALVAAAVELILATLRVGGQLIGVSAVIAVVANVILARFAYAAVGAKSAVALPAVTWFAVMMAAAGRTDEGDILLAGNNWVGLAIIVAGSIAFAIVGYRLILPPR